MRVIVLGLLAATGIAVSAPAVAEDFYVGGPGIGVEIGNGHRDHRNWREDRYRTEGFYRHEGRARCETTIIRRDDGSVKRIRRCRD